jgi:hypothetical protein
MLKTAGLIVLLALAACSGMPRASYGGSPCQANPGGYQCEIQRYMNAS